MVNKADQPDLEVVPRCSYLANERRFTSRDTLHELDDEARTTPADRANILREKGAV